MRVLQDLLLLGPGSIPLSRVAEATSSSREQRKLGFQATAILDNNKSQSNIDFIRRLSKQSVPELQKQ